MDVRCEKCQTEYELDESRLKPGGVTVKCTNCGHMFKIRKRSNTNVGVAAGQAPTPPAPSPRSEDLTKPAVPQPQPPRPASTSGEAPVSVQDMPSGPMSAGVGERQWLVRLENGESKTCKELATLQQWIVASVVTRESLISRSGKTWKRLGDIPELAQYFVIADEAKNTRAGKPTGKPGVAGTMLGMAGAPRPGTEDDLEGRTTGTYRARPGTPPPPPPAAAEAPPAPRRPPTEPPPPPPAAAKVKVPADAGRQTAAWAQSEIKASASMAAMPQGPRAGKLSASPDEKAYGGRVRLQPGDDAAFKSGQIRSADDDDDAGLYPQRRGSRVGMWIALFSLLVIGAAAGAVYMFVFNKKTPVAQPTSVADAAVATATGDAAAIATAPSDAAAEVPANPLDAAKAELLAGVSTRITATLASLAGKDDPASLAMRARLSTALAQAMQDRAGFIEKTEGDKLRKQAKQLVVDAAPLAQRAFNGQQDSTSANLAMADVLRLQGKAAPAVRRYIDTARSKAAGDSETIASVALAESQLLVRDGKLPDAEKALAGLDSTVDMRIKLELALIAFTQAKPADAKALVDQIIATQPDHEVAQAMYAKLGTSVATTDAMPPEDGSAGHGSAAGSGSATTNTTTNTTTTNNNTGTGTGTGTGGGGGDYDSLLNKANKLAETNCSKAMELYAKALELKSNGVEALTGMGYCHLDAKQFSSAFSKFRAALAVSSRYEPALGGIAETYQRQGNKDAAIEAWKNYLDIYPGSAKAKKQLEILGADSSGGSSGGGNTGGGSSTGGSTPTPDKQPDSGSSTPPPAPTPAPTPAPVPAEGSASN